MRIDIMTLFPELIDGVMHESIIGRAQAKGLIEIRATNIRDYALDKHHKADDSPYGGGRGMVMLPEPLYLCHEALTGGTHVHTVMMSAQGAPFTQQKARELLSHERFIIVCGHYEGIDQRFIDTCVDEEISIGDFVLTGGEIPAMAVADAVCRMVPGVLPDETAFQEESHWNGLLEYPQYTIRRSGADSMCRRCCFPGIMPILRVGGERCRSCAHGATVRICLQHFSRRTSKIAKFWLKLKLRD